jgi:hypothetical protein
MKAEALKERPKYELFKVNDDISYGHLQLPRWILTECRYKYLSIEAKFVYTLLFNRFQLSKRNGWVNGDGEVFVIYTRQELSEDCNISEKRISAAMIELKGHSLIWERRCGRGFANQIYLANVRLSNEYSESTKVGVFESVEKPIVCDELENDETVYNGSRTDEIGVLDCVDDIDGGILFQEDDNLKDESGNNNGPQRLTFNMEIQEPPIPDFKNRRNGGSITVNSSVQDPLESPFIYKDIKEKETKKYIRSLSMSSPVSHNARAKPDERTDTDKINEIWEQAEIDMFPEDEAELIKDAIERLYFMQSITVGGAVYSNERIRLNLSRLDSLIIQDTINRLSKNTTHTIRNSSAYVVTVLFNTIMEITSDLFVDPYLNSLKKTV